MIQVTLLIPLCSGPFYHTMDKMGRFPDNFGHELAGMSFEEVWDEHPKWISFVTTCWTDNCSGLFLEFLQFVRNRMADDDMKLDHEKRCLEFVRELLVVKPDSELPSYLEKYRCLICPQIE